MRSFRTAVAALVALILLQAPHGAEPDVKADDDDAVARLRQLGARMTWESRRLVRVDLSENPRARQALPLVAGLPHLRVLDLSKTDLNDADVKHLAGLSSLVALDLSGTEITDEGLLALRPLVEAPAAKLQQLKLRGSQCTPQGPECLGAPQTLTTDFQLGTAINWAQSLGEAIVRTRKEGKLLFVIHVSGDFTVPENT